MLARLIPLLCGTAAGLALTATACTAATPAASATPPAAGADVKPHIFLLYVDGAPGNRARAPAFYK